MAASGASSGCSPLQAASQPHHAAPTHRRAPRTWGRSAGPGLGGGRCSAGSKQCECASGRWVLEAGVQGAQGIISAAPAAGYIARMGVARASGHACQPGRPSHQPDRGIPRQAAPRVPSTLNSGCTHPDHACGPQGRGWGALWGDPALLAHPRMGGSRRAHNGCAHPSPHTAWAGLDKAHPACSAPAHRAPPDLGSPAGTTAAVAAVLAPLHSRRAHTRPPALGCQSCLQSPGRAQPATYAATAACSMQHRHIRHRRSTAAHLAGAPQAGRAARCRLPPAAAAAPAGGLPHRSSSSSRPALGSTRACTGTAAAVRAGQGTTAGGRAAVVPDAKHRARAGPSQGRRPASCRPAPTLVGHGGATLARQVGHTPAPRADAAACSRHANVAALLKTPGRPGGRRAAPCVWRDASDSAAAGQARTLPPAAAAPHGWGCMPPAAAKSKPRRVQPVFLELQPVFLRCWMTCGQAYMFCSRLNCCVQEDLLERRGGPRG